MFKRLHGTSEDFFTPHDFEVTYAELAYICDKARKWTHPKGKGPFATKSFKRVIGPVYGCKWPSQSYWVLGFVNEDTL